MDLETTTQVDTAAPRYSDTENIRSVRSCVNTCGYRSFSLSYSGGTVASPRLASPVEYHCPGSGQVTRNVSEAQARLQLQPVTHNV